MSRLTFEMFGDRVQIELMDEEGDAMNFTLLEDDIKPLVTLLQSDRNENQSMSFESNEPPDMFDGDMVSED